MFTSVQNIIGRLPGRSSLYRPFWLPSIAVGSIILYMLLAFRYPLMASLADPRATWALMVYPTSINLSYHLAIYLGLTVLYMLALRLLNAYLSDSRRHSLLIVGVWLVCSAVLLTVAPGGESHDIFDYTFRGRMIVEYGANPLAGAPEELSKAPFYRYAAWIRHVDTYGPLWEMTSAGVAVVVRFVLKASDLWTTTQISCPRSPASCKMLSVYLVSYRLLAITLTGVSAWLIMSMVRRNRPNLATAALAAWLWSPMLLITTAIGAHNDAVMIVLLLASLWLLQRQRWLPALLVLVLALHVKVTVLIFLPAIGLWIVRRRGWLRTIGVSTAAGVIGLLLSWLLYAPFEGWSTLPRMLHERSIFLANSPWHVIYYVLYIQRHWPKEMVLGLTVQLPTLLFVVSAVLVALWMLDFRPNRWKRSPAPDWGDERMLWRTIAGLSLLYLLVGSFWFQHWYVLWVLAPAALLPDSILTRVVLPCLSFGALSANVVADFVRTPMPKAAPRTRLYALVVLVIWMPALIAGGIAESFRFYRHRQERKQASPRMPSV